MHRYDVYIPVYVDDIREYIDICTDMMYIYRYMYMI